MNKTQNIISWVAQVVAGTSGSGTPIDLGTSAYGDDPIDQANIKRGIQYYQEGCFSR